MARFNNSTSAECGVKDEQYALFEQIDTLFGVDSNHFFKHVLNERLSQVCVKNTSLRFKNIATQLKSPHYFACVDHPLANEPAQWHHLEIIALKLFDDWAQAWCAFNIWQIERKYQQQPHALRLNTTPDFSQNEEDYIDGVIEEIENHPNLYYTLHCQYALELPDAAMLINLSTFVWEQHWYEMLYEIDVSARGTHFVLAQIIAKLPLPVIVSTAKVNQNTNANNWLYFSPFFQTNCWQLMNQDRVKKRLVELNLLSSAACLPDTSSANYENTLWRNLTDHDKCCEIIRLTVSGKQNHKIFYLYLSQKRLMAQLQTLGFKIAFVVIEQPLMVHYYQSIQECAYLPLSHNETSDSGFTTYKGLWFIDQLNKALSECNYRSYKTGAIIQLKRHRQHRQELNYA